MRHANPWMFMPRACASFGLGDEDDSWILFWVDQRHFIFFIVCRVYMSNSSKVYTQFRIVTLIVIITLM